MEQVLFISKKEHLKYFNKNFTRLYFGQEFCERLIPKKEHIEEVLSFVAKEQLSLTFVTPYVTNKGLKYLEDILEFLKKKKPDAEIVFNDWGVLQFLKYEAPEFTRVMGRLLNKIKRGPRILNIFNQLPESTRDFFQGSNFDVPSVTRFLQENNIARVEYDNLLQGINLDTTDTHIHKSLYMPFAFVSTTRFCLCAHCDDPDTFDYVGILPCAMECQHYTFNLFNPVMHIPLIRKGNTIFFLNETIPAIVEKRQVDRIVIQPEIPI